jgi:hypothetical protein
MQTDSRGGVVSERSIKHFQQYNQSRAAAIEQAGNALSRPQL